MHYFTNLLFTINYRIIISTYSGNVSTTIKTIHPINAYSQSNYSNYLVITKSNYPIPGPPIGAIRRYCLRPTPRERNGNWPRGLLLNCYTLNSFSLSIFIYISIFISHIDAINITFLLFFPYLEEIMYSFLLSYFILPYFGSNKLQSID